MVVPYGSISENNVLHSDVWKHIYDDHRAVVLGSGILRGPVGGILAGQNVTAQPIKLSGGKWIPVLAGDEANVQSLIYSDLYLGKGLAAATDYGLPIAYLKNGPAVINQDALPVKDVVGTNNLNWTTLKTALAAIFYNLQFISEPTKQTVINP